MLYYRMEQKGTEREEGGKNTDTRNRIIPQDLRLKHCGLCGARRETQQTELGILACKECFRNDPDLQDEKWEAR